MKKIIIAIAALALAGPAMASHNNPWAEEGDVLLAKNHEQNQAKSIGTPGEDEMKGEMHQNVSDNAGGGFGGEGPADGTGHQGGGKGGGQGGHDGAKGGGRSR